MVKLSYCAVAGCRDRVSTRHLQPRDKLCILMFDEMALEPHVSLNTHTFQFEGFEDTGEGNTTGVIADHVLVFMVRGITKSWKQPLVYSFCKSSTKTVDLVRLLKTVISNCQQAGLKIVATVSDQGATNCAAINYLKKHFPDKDNYQQDLKIYNVNGQTIVHVFDPPHLLKGIRNNLINKNLIWKKNKEIYTAKWDHITKVYNIDNSSGDLRLLPKLTECHVVPQKIKKMKVSIAAQVFSHSVASVMQLLSRVNLPLSENNLDASGSQTAEVLKFFDKLFDSVNGNTLFPKNGKILKCAVSSSSGHVMFWREARNHLKNMYFVNVISKEETVPPSLKNWICTLAGMEELLKILKENHITFFRPKMINQDPIENFFGQLRQHGGRNVNPTVTHFKQYYKTLLLNNFITRHSLSANCEKDSSFNIISSVKQFITQGVPEEDYDNLENVHSLLNMTMPQKTLTYIDTITVGYVSGFVSKKIKSINTCQTCKNNIICTNKLDQWHDLCVAKEFANSVPNKLKYCTPNFITGINQIYAVFKPLLLQTYKRKDFLQLLLYFLNRNINFEFNECEHTELVKKTAIKHFTILCCHNWADGINKILRGEDARHKILDVVYKAAFDYSQKRKRNRGN